MKFTPDFIPLIVQVPYLLFCGQIRVFAYEEFIHERKSQQKRNINYIHYLQHTQVISFDN